MTTERRASVVSAVSSRTRTVTESLGLNQEEVAEIVGTSARTISRWWSGETTPQPPKQKRLREVAYVAEEISKVLEADGAREWLFTPNRQLGHDSPAEKIAKGEYRAVLALIEALADGVVA